MRARKSQKKAKKKAKKAKAAAKLTAILGRNPDSDPPLIVVKKDDLAKVWIGKRKKRRDTAAKVGLSPGQIWLGDVKTGINDGE